MRILFFSRDYTTHDRRFLQKLAASRHTVFFLRLEDDGIHYVKSPLPEGVKEIEWKGGRRPIKKTNQLLDLMPSFQSVLDQIKPDLIHAGPVPTCGFMSALAGFHPLLVMSWGSDILVKADRDDASRWVTQYTLRHADYFVCDCRAVRDKAQSIYPIEDSRIVQFPWGIDLERFPSQNGMSALRVQLDWQDKFVVLSTRSWEPIYGIQTLLESFRRALDKNPLLRLILLGAGSLASYVDEFIESHQLQGAIHRPGIVSQQEIPSYFRASDLYMSCTLSDGASISLLEAMASGLPVLASDAPGNREWIVNNENGWLAQPENVESFSEALLAASLTDLNQRKTMARQNRGIAHQRADWNQNAQKLLDLYDRIESQTA